MKYILTLLLLLSAYVYAEPSNITLDQVLELSNPEHNDEKYELYCVARGFQHFEEDDRLIYGFHLPDPFYDFIEFQYQVYFQPGQNDGIAGIDAAEIKGIKEDFFKIGGTNIVDSGYGAINQQYGFLGLAVRLPAEDGGTYENLQIGTLNIYDPISKISMDEIDILSYNPYGEKELTMSYHVREDKTLKVFAPVSCRITKITKDTDDSAQDNNTTPDDQTPNPTQEISDGGGSMPFSIFLLAVLVGARRMAKYD